ncbi:hypothetical protein HDU85_005715 [Gaertneriomyces sp. JEL0708]|nr:hypothetical protein HDU85_005715 [Gaertneriomyces sp. JEL0708]
MTTVQQPKQARKHVRLLVLEADTPQDIHDEHSSYAELFADILNRAADQQNINLDMTSRYIVRDNHCNLPDEEEMNEFQSVLISGSRHDAHGDEEWVLRLRDWIRRVWKNKPHVNFSGVCFGHQILARALGGRLGSGPTGWELARTRIHLTDTGKHFFGVDSDDIHLHQLHQDEVVECPTHASSDGLLKPDENVEVWGSSDKCKVQGLYIRGRMFTTQGHLELADELVRIQVEHHVDEGAVEQHVADKANEKENTEHDGEMVAGAILRFCADLDHKDQSRTASHEHSPNGMNK